MRLHHFRIYAAALICLTLTFAIPAARADQASKLDAVAADVAHKWPKLHHAAPDEVSGLIDSGAAVVFDVRTADEYAVSHLPGAILVEPAMSKDAFLAAHGAALKGKTAVFYCAVGVRSSKLAERVGADALQSAGATSSVNLSGGIFAWHGAEKPLIDANGPTKLVHGYDATWGKLVKRQDMLATEPAK